MNARQASIVDLSADIHLPKKDDWLTPPSILEPLNDEFHFDFDPCPYPRGLFDGLQVEWRKSNFVNPPFSNPGPWAKKAVLEQAKGNRTVFIHPCNDSLFRLLAHCSSFKCYSGRDARFIDPVDRKLKRINYDVLAIVLEGASSNQENNVKED